MHIGVVLRYIPEKSRIVIYDRTYGKYTGVCFTAVAAGSCIAYDMSGNDQHKRIAIREVLYVPLMLARSHLTFLHHMLEVCDLSIPLENADITIFSILLLICADQHHSLTEHQQNLIFAKLLVSLGLHTTYTIVCDLCIARIHASSVDTIIDITLDSKCVEKMDSWIYHCLSEQLPTPCLKMRELYKKRIGLT